MKKSLIYSLALALGLAASTALTSCDDNFERPPMVTPVAKNKPNTTIADLKAAFFDAANNYAVQVGLREDGSHYIIHGYVTTTDQPGNFFKQIVIQDETSAIQVDLDMYDLYQSYQMGQEVVIDVTGLYIGAYGQLMQIGAAPTSGYPSRIAEAVATEQVEVNGLASPGNIAPVEMTVAEIAAVSTTSAEGIALQCKFVSIPDVTFKNAGKQTLSTSGSNGVSQNFGNDGGQLILYTSGYSDFYDYYCPTGTGRVVGILSCYNGKWQVRISSIDALVGFDELTKDAPDLPNVPGQGDGTEANPYTCADVIGGATGTDAWVKGYIVGWVEGQVLASGAHFDAAATVASNLLIAATADEKTVANCVTVQLPTGDVRNALNLQSNPGNLGKEVLLKGNLEAYFGVPGVKSVSAYKIDGAGAPDQPTGPVEPVSSINENFDASTALPAGWTQIQVAGNKAWYIATYNGNNYASMTGYKGTAPFDQVLLTPPVDMAKVTDKVLTFDTQVNGYGSTTSTIEVYVVTEAQLTDITKGVKLDAKWAVAPASGYSEWVNSGSLDLSKFTGTVYIAFRYAATTDANYATWCVDNVKLN